MVIIKLRLNDFFIRDVILRKDGGFILTAEDFYSQSRCVPWNRYDYLYGYPSFSPYNYYLLFALFLWILWTAIPSIIHVARTGIIITIF